MDIKKNIMNLIKKIINFITSGWFYTKMPANKDALKNIKK